MPITASMELTVMSRMTMHMTIAHAPVVSGHPHGSALHVSVAVVIALTVHNIIEGMSVYGVATQSVTAAFLLAFGIGIHNMPMGMIIYSGVRDQSLGRRVGILAVAALSTFVGGLDHARDWLGSR